MKGRRLNEDLVNVLCRESVLLACVGTELRSDDRVGLEFCSRLKAIKPDAPAVECEFGLENCLDAILKLRPDTLVIVDAVIPEGGDVRAGDVILAPTDSAVSNVAPVSTHNIPLTALLKFIRSSGCCREAYVLGIVAKDLSIGEDITPEVLKAVEALAKAVAEILETCGEGLT